MTGAPVLLEAPTPLAAPVVDTHTHLDVHDRDLHGSDRPDIETLLALAEQVNAGAPVDVLATASPATMARVGGVAAWGALADILECATESAHNAALSGSLAQEIQHHLHIGRCRWRFRRDLGYLGLRLGKCQAIAVQGLVHGLDSAHALG